MVEPFKAGVVDQLGADFALLIMAKAVLPTSNAKRNEVVKTVRCVSNYGYYLSDGTVALAYTAAKDHLLN